MTAAPTGSAPDPNELHGALRDAIASLQNLYALLRSAKVGPRAIAAVLPEIAQQLGPLPQLVASTLASEASGGGSDEAHSLAGFTSERLREAEQSVLRATRAGVDAKSRLSLEADLARLTPPIESARALIELLHASLESPVELDLSELLSQALDTPSQRMVLSGPMVTVQVELPDHGKFLLLASARVAMQLFHFAIAHAAATQPIVGEKGAARMLPLRLAVCEPPAVSDKIAVEVGGAARAGWGDAMLVRLPLLIAPMQGVLDVVARRCGGRVVLEAGKPRALVELPMAPEGELSTTRAR